MLRNLRRCLCTAVLVGAAAFGPDAVVGEEPPTAAAGEAHEPDAAPSPESAPAPMTGERLFALLEAEKLAPEGDATQATFYVGTARVYMLVDPVNDRMRFGIPVRKLEDLGEGELLELLKANYAATMDVRFAVNRGVVWLLYLHPLGSLTERDALSAINLLAHHAAPPAGA